jgi:hypothetical protein
MSNSETILPATDATDDSSPSTVTGANFKGDGYYSRTDGFHTVQYNYAGLTGTITIQATLATTPTDTDWFDVHTYTAAQETSSKIANFTGNYVWIRATVTITNGTVNSITLNH